MTDEASTGSEQGKRPSLVEIAKCDLPIRHYIIALEGQLAAAREQANVIDAKVIDALETRVAAQAARIRALEAVLEAIGHIYQTNPTDGGPLRLVYELADAALADLEARAALRSEGGE